MYPVYRGWSEPELVIEVGAERQQFRGPRRQLAEQSGYIRALLESSTTGEISLPGVNPHIFQHILGYVNTGYLELSPENVYAVLLASHMLQMPRAVDLCRGYLLHSEQQPRLPILVKPIPSRKYLPTLYWPPPPIIPPPTFYPPPPPISVPPPLDPVPSTSINNLSETSLPLSQAQPSKHNSQNSNKKIKEVVKDIACCDGPVRFKRVLNTNYGFLSDSHSVTEERMGEEKQVYVCGFCKHTFKSHYCYRKHTRRHINPVVSVKPIENESRDMNVQYYPCKTCGSKFPSYYFVHKHRKMCHVNENDVEEKVSQNSDDCSNQLMTP